MYKSYINTEQFERVEPIITYTDGAYSVHTPQSPGGWAWVKLFNNKMTFGNGGEYDTTNNKMELMATIQALHSVKSGSDVILYTDSKYVCNGITKWIYNWKRNNWKGVSGKAVKNLDLWKSLDSLNKKSTVTWQWVKGHSDNDWNALVDILAVRGCENILKEDNV